MIGHIHRAFVNAIADVGAGNHLTATRADPHQLLVGDTEALRVGAIDLHPARLIGKRLQGRAVAGHRTTRVVADFAHGTKHQRIRFIRRLGRRAPRGGEQLAFAGWRIEEVIFIQPRRTGVIQRRARPLDVVHIAHFLVGDAIEQRTKLAHFVPDLLVVIVMHRVAHFAGQQADDFPVALNISGGDNRLLEALEAAVGAGKDAAVFAPGGSGQQHIGDFGGFGHKDILHHHKIERLNPLTHQT